jgi:uncharacterized protein YecE (DUF72 family)
MGGVNAPPPAASRPGTAHVGCSGWDYRDWRGVVYPSDLPKRRWFAHYASLFDTVELNATFYRLPRPETVEGWGAQAPAGFVYAVKLGAFGSHRMKLRDARSWLPNHLDRALRLGDALGPTLVQLPPRWRVDAARLDDFLAMAAASRGPGGRPLRWSVELRERSWLTDAVFEVLHRHDAALCIHDLLDDHPWELTADWSYLRFHGPAARAQPYRGRYGGRRLWRVADRLGRWLAEGHDVYAYFNNDWDGHAVADAAWLDRRLRPTGGTATAG